MGADPNNNDDASISKASRLLSGTEDVFLIINRRIRHFEAVPMYQLLTGLVDFLGKIKSYFLFFNSDFENHQQGNGTVYLHLLRYIHTIFNLLSSIVKVYGNTKQTQSRSSTIIWEPYSRR